MLKREEFKINTKVISAFPACGKSYCYNAYQGLFDGILDSDSSEFSWVKDSEGNNTKERNRDFPNNYIQHIKDNIGKVEIIFVSSHDVVRETLKNNNIDYTIVYPLINQKEEWVKRFKRRGNDEKFINFISRNWDKFITDIDKETFPLKLRLPHNEREYLDLSILLKIIDYKEIEKEEY